MTTTTATPKMPFDREKFAELLLYVASRMAGDPAYGSVKENKVLFFSDVIHYAEYGQPISGATYIHRPKGPAPKGLRAIQEELIRSGAADLAILRSRGRVQKIMFAKREADLTRFSGTEIAVVDDVIRALADSTGEQASDISHKLAGWYVTQEGEVIPYEATFLYEGSLTERDILHGQQVAAGLQQELQNAGFPSADAA